MDRVLSEFTHVSEGVARAEDLDVSICAVLVAEACNIGLEPVVRAGTPALTRARLSWVDQNYIRSGRPAHPARRAVAELGRITKTLYLLAYLDDEAYRPPYPHPTQPHRKPTRPSPSPSRLPRSTRPAPTALPRRTRRPTQRRAPSSIRSPVLRLQAVALPGSGGAAASLSGTEKEALAATHRP